MFGLFAKDRAGNVALLFGLLLPVLIAAGGGGLEIARALEYKARLVSATDLTCNQAERYIEATLTDNPKLNYTSSVQAYGTQNKTEKSLNNATITVTPVPTIKPVSVVVTSSGSIDLVFKSVLSKDSIDFTVTRTCLVDVNSISPPGTLLISESFENNHSVASNNWSVLGNNQQGNAWNGWVTQNAGIEINGMPQLTGNSIRFGNFFAELDSDCQGRSGCSKTNSAMSRYVNLTKNTTYEVRYWYVARKRPDVDSDPYPGKDIVCSSSSSTTGAQRNTEVNTIYNNMTKTGPAKDEQTRRIELYVEPKDSTAYIDFTKGNNTNYTDMVDVCIWSDEWTERVYSFKAKQSGEHRFSWAAAGKQDTYGGLIDYLRICQGTCP